MENMNFGTNPEPGFEQEAAQDPILEPQEAAEEQAEVIELSREEMLAELHAYCKNWLTEAQNWRRTTWEDQWRRWQRNADSVYDEELKSKKEPWQSTAVWPLTASHRENAQSQLFKTEVGPRPPLDVVARKGVVPQNVPGADQSENIRDLILREREKAEYEINRNSVLEDKTTYGDGFAQVIFDTDIQDRLVWEDVPEPLLDPREDGGASIQRSMAGQPNIVERRRVVKPQVIYRGVRFRPQSVWDVFPDPKALKIQGSGLPIALRYYTTYEDVVNGAKPDPVSGGPGYVLPEAVEALKGVPSDETTPVDKQQVQADREISDSIVTRTDFGRRFECFEMQARLPKKWVLINGEDIDDPEALMPAKVRFHSTTVISVLPSDSYDGEPDIYKDGYMPVAGQFYSRGIPEMLKDAQAVATETVNQRLDSGAISLKKCFAVIEKSIVNTEDFNNISNGGVIRLKGKDGMTNIDQLFKALDLGTIDRSAFIEPQEWERAAQERTSITATTLGSEDNSNTTLGAQKIQVGVSSGKIAYIGMLSEFGFQRQVFHAFWKLIYANYQPEDYAMALGQERAQTVIPMTPEEVNNNYQYVPLGIFELESKQSRQQGLQAMDAQFGQMPWFNRLENAKEQARILDLSEEKLILPEADATQIIMKAEEMAVGMAQQMHQEMMAKTKPGGLGGPPAGPAALEGQP